MKFVSLIIGVSILVLLSSSFSQEERKFSFRGGVTSNYLALRKKVNSGLPSTVRYTNVGSSTLDYFALGVRFMGAYNISTSLRVGVQGNYFINGSLNFIIPVFYVNYKAGPFAEYFPLDNIGLTALINYTKLSSIPGGLSIGVGPTYYFGKKDNAGLGIIVEYFGAIRNVNYKGYDFNQDNDIVNYSGTAPLITHGFSFELAFTFSLY